MDKEDVKEPRVRVMVELPSRQVAMLKLYAQSKGISLSGVIRMSVERMMENEFGFFDAVRPLVDLVVPKDEGG